MQLVQRTMLPGSGPSELAEVLVGGLVTRARADQGGDGSQWYEIDPEVREALLSRLGRDEAMLVLKHCSEYIEQHFGKGGPNFPALALAQLGDGGPGRPHPHPSGGEPGYPGENGGDAGTAPVPQPFAEVAARILERFMPLPEQFATYDSRTGPQVTAERPTHRAVVRARALLARFVRRGHGPGRHRRRAAAARRHRAGTAGRRRPGAGRGEYARCTLRLWEVQGGTALLREATRAAERAAASPHALRERAVLARVLHAAATDSDDGAETGPAHSTCCGAPTGSTRSPARHPAWTRRRRFGSPWNGSPPWRPSGAWAATAPFCRVPSACWRRSPTPGPTAATAPLSCCWPTAAPCCACRR
ncbi:hypothetical protein [Streptomyces lividans]|nr:hypothetical protein [Streptomyces lividans]